LDRVQTALNFAQTMTWKGKNPVVKLIQGSYQTGVKLTKKQMLDIESQIQRLPQLPHWFVDIFPNSR
jgi:Rhodopirellula transposase DDE domain